MEVNIRAGAEVYIGALVAGLRQITIGNERCTNAEKMLNNLSYRKPAFTLPVADG
jgi:hypothetical protein